MLTTSDDTNDKKDDDVIETTPTDLTAVHAQEVEKLENEPAEDAEDDDEDDDAPADPKKDDSEDDDDDSDGDDDDSGSSDDGGEDDEDEEPETPPAKPEPEAPQAPDKPIELNTNPEENANGKIAVKDYDGKQWYFNNLDEVPDDFEPDTYKNWGKAVEQFARKSISDDKAAEENRIREEQTRQQAEIDEVTQRWDREQASMLKSGLLPKDAKAREVEVNDTLVYIGKQLDKGNIIESFEAAHKARKYDEGKSNKAKNDKKRGEIRKTRGAKVLGGGGGQTNKKAKGDPLPPGTSLDAVHARYSGLV